MFPVSSIHIYWSLLECAIIGPRHAMGPAAPALWLAHSLFSVQTTLFKKLKTGQKNSFTLECWDVGAGQTRICLMFTVSDCPTVRHLHNLPCENWEDFPSEQVCDEESYTISQLHYYSGSKFLFHFTDLGVSTQTHFSVHLPDVWQRNPTHKPVRGRLWRVKGSLDYGWGKDPEKPRSAFRISGGAPSWTYVTCCVRKLMKTTCSDRRLMWITCGAFVNKRKRNALRQSS